MRQIESKIQQDCVYWFRTAYPQYRKLLFSVPNGGFRNITTARRMTAEGVVSGVSDLILFIASHEHHALCIEMKTTKGRQSEHQQQWQKEVEKQGYQYSICHSLDEFKATIITYLRMTTI